MTTAQQQQQQQQQNALKQYCKFFEAQQFAATAAQPTKLSELSACNGDSPQAAQRRPCSAEDSYVCGISVGEHVSLKSIMLTKIMIAIIMTFVVVAI